MSASTDRVDLLNTAKAEKAALVKWEQGGRKGDRPATPATDAITAEFNAPGAKSRKARSTEGRKPSENVEKIRQLFMTGAITHAATKGELAQLLDVPRSTAGNAVRRLVASGEMTVTEKPLRFWLDAAGKANPVPERPAKAERPARERKTYIVITKSGTTHTAHRTRALGLVPICIPEGGKIPAATLADEQDVTPSCKRCTKALAAAAAV